MISDIAGKFLLKISRKVLENHVKNIDTEIPEKHPEELNEKRGVFCTLYKNNELRGCIGLPNPDIELIEGVKQATIESAHDPRFEPLREEELDKVEIELSILSKIKKTELNDIKKGDGVILKNGIKNALFLPQVWKEIPDKKIFLEQLSLKAGLNKNAYMNKESEFFKFSVQTFRE